MAIAALFLVASAVRVEGMRPALSARSALSVRQAVRVTLPVTMSIGGPNKGFGKDPATEARVSKKLAQLRSPEQLRRLEEEREREKMEQYIVDEGLDVMPEVVGDRMLKRMIFFLGVPLFGGIAAFAAFIIAARNFDTTIRPTTVALTTQAILALGVVGITYGPLSASWDEDREGSLLGFEEVGKNLESVLQSLRGPPRM
ncbi:hypothetical protein KFE25_013545 [Diacronema lutheri]|uniref:Uncharacterized protein n=1 Tax=Diacronema lutheri TaxID=2081491 RepID=A0A8J5XTZ9_DIALT|nr:hypothetical protein KFE25_013545 [Diacronema lutheri]